MEYDLRIGEHDYRIESNRAEKSGTVLVKTNETAVGVEVRAISPNHFFLNVDGQAVNLFTARDKEGTWVWVDGAARFVQDAATLRRRRSRSLEEASRVVTPPTPASVVRVMVSVGDIVKKGQALVVVSAMKMEITLAAPHAGRIIAVNVEAGAQASPGDILVEIEELAEDEVDE